MQRLYLLLVILITFLLAGIYFDSWWPWLVTQLDGKVGATIQSLANLIQIIIWIIVAGFAIITFKSHAASKDKQHTTPQKAAKPTQELKHLYLKQLDQQCEFLRLGLISKAIQEKVGSLSLSAVYQDQHLRLLVANKESQKSG